MSSTKYKQYYDRMVEENLSIFSEFRTIHDNFQSDPAKYADEFHTVGRDVLDIVRDWDRRLCSGMERGRYSAYSDQLSEKFWAIVRKHFPVIEQVGVKVVYHKPTT